MQAFGGRVGRSGHAAERIGGLAHRKLRLHRFLKTSSMWSSPATAGPFANPFPSSGVRPGPATIRANPLKQDAAKAVNGERLPETRVDYCDVLAQRCI